MWVGGDVEPHPLKLTAKSVPPRDRQQVDAVRQPGAIHLKPVRQQHLVGLRMPLEPDHPLNHIRGEKDIVLQA